MIAVYPSMSIPIEPLFAPLSTPMILQALEFQNETPNEEMDAPASPYERLRLRLLKPREETFELLQPAVKAGEFDTDFLLKKLSEFTPQKKMDSPRLLSAESLSHWRKIGLVRYESKNQPNADNGAALITLRRMVQHRERKWLPNPRKLDRTHFLNEPIWWCWRQDSLSSPLIKCPVPLTEDVPPHALLWTDWRGAAWKPEWLSVGNLGCSRWAGTYVRDGALLWAITEEELSERWGIPINADYKQALAATPLTLHTLATSALLLLTTKYLEELKNLKSLPLAG